MKVFAIFIFLKEFYYTVGATVFYFIAMIVQFVVAYSDSGTAAAVSHISKSLILFPKPIKIYHDINF